MSACMSVEFISGYTALTNHIQWDYRAYLDSVDFHISIFFLSLQHFLGSYYSKWLMTVSFHWCALNVAYFCYYKQTVGIEPPTTILAYWLCFFSAWMWDCFFFFPVSNVALFNAVTLCNKALEGTAQYVCSTTITGVIQSIGEVGYFVLSSQS